MTALRVRLSSLAARIRGRLVARATPIAAVGVAVLAASTSAVLIRLGDAPEPVMAFYRVLFTIFLLAPLARGTGVDLRGLGPRDAVGAAAAGVALAVHFAAWFESVALTTVAASVTLVQTQPVFVALGAAVLLDERLPRRALAGVLLAVGGAVAMSADEFGAVAAPDALLGNALAVAGAVAAAVYLLAGRSLRQRVALVPYVLVVYAVCAAVLLGYALADGHALAGYPPREWLLFLAMAVGPGILGHTLINWALEYVESGVVSVSLVGEPVASTLLALVVLGEAPGPLTVLGGGVVLAGIVVTARARSRET